jgi:hypothetical protein
MDRQTAQKEVNQFEAVEEGKGGEASFGERIVCSKLTFVRLYWHPNLRYSVMVKLYDHFTKHDLFRQ